MAALNNMRNDYRSNRTMKKGVKILLCVAAILLLSIGGESIVAQERNVSKLATLYYRLNGTYPTEQHRKELDEIIVLMACDKEMKIVVVSHVDKSGEREVNDLISDFRAENVVEYMCGRVFVDGKLDPKRFKTISKGIDYAAPSDSLARRVDVFREVEEFVVVREVGGYALEDEHIENAEESIAVVESITSAITTTLDMKVDKIEPIEPKVAAEAEMKKFTLRTNLLYWCGGMINGGVEWRPGRGGVGVVLNGGYSPFANQDWEYNMGGYFVAPEVRFYMGQRRRGYLGVQGIVAGYNYKMSYIGYQGDMYGAGVVGGYRAPISSRLDLDFTLGAGAAQFDYGTYHITDAGLSIYIDDDLQKRCIVPIELGVSLIWGK